MEKIILKDKTELNLKYSEGLKLVVENRTINELEMILTESNLSYVEFLNNKSGTYGKLNNLKLISLTKNYITNETTIYLKEPNTTE